MESFVVIGLGRFGSVLAKSLHSMGNEVLAIDENPRLVQDISEYVTQAVTGDCRDENVLHAVDIKTFDCAVVAMSGNIEASVIITRLLKIAGVKYIVAKASSDLHADILSKVGADKIVFPERDMGIKMAQNLSSASVLDFIELSDKFSIVEVQIPQKWIGKSLRQLNVRADYGINVVAIKNSAKNLITVTIDPDKPFEATDILVVIGSNEDVTRIVK